MAIDKDVISFELRLTELHARAKRPCGGSKLSKSTHPRKIGNHVTVHRPTERPSDLPSTPQAYQCKIT